MREGDVRERAFAMPLTNPAYPPGAVPLRQSRVSHHQLSHQWKSSRAVPEPLGPQGGIGQCQQDEAGQAKGRQR